MLSPVPGPGKKSFKTKSSKQKEPKNKGQKKDRSKEDNKKDSDKRSKEELHNIAGEKIPVLDVSSVKNNVESSDSVVSSSKLTLLEARRRKFESTGPVKPDGKKIRLKTTQPPHQMQLQEEQEREMTQKAPQEPTLEEKNEVIGTVVTALDDSATLQTGEDLDEPYLELQSADLWSSEESDSGNEARFKSNARIQGAGSEKVM
jgi:hypothetical protein